MTISKGRGAKADQCSCFDTAMSAQMPIKNNSNHKRKQVRYNSSINWKKKKNQSQIAPGMASATNQISLQHMKINEISLSSEKIVDVSYDTR